MREGKGREIGGMVLLSDVIVTEIVGGSMDLIEFDPLNEQPHDLGAPFLPGSLFPFINSVRFWLEMSDPFDPELAAPEIDHGAMFVQVG